MPVNNFFSTGIVYDDKSSFRSLKCPSPVILPPYTNPCFVASYNRTLSDALTKDCIQTAGFSGETLYHIHKTATAKFQSEYILIHFPHPLERDVLAGMEIGG